MVQNNDSFICSDIKKDKKLNMEMEIDSNILFLKSNGNIEKILYVGEKGFEINAKTIKADALENDNYIEFIKINDDELTIETDAIHNCSKLKSIKIDNTENVSIQSYAFTDCPELETVCIKAEKIELEGKCFANCFNLKNIILCGNIITLANDFCTDSNNAVLYIQKDDGGIKKVCRGLNIKVKVL